MKVRFQMFYITTKKCANCGLRFEVINPHQSELFKFCSIECEENFMIIPSLKN